MLEISTISNQGSGKLDIGNNEINNQTNNADDAANTTNNTIRKLRLRLNYLIKLRRDLMREVCVILQQFIPALHIFLQQN